MDSLKKISTFIEYFNKRIGHATTACTLLMVIVTVIDVSLRYLFKSGSVAIQELEWHLFGFVFLIGAAYTFYEDEHVRIDIFYSRMSTTSKAWVNLFGTTLFCLPMCIVIIWTSLPFVISSWQVLEGSPDPGGLPARYILKSAIPIGFLLVSFQSVAVAIRSLEIILVKKSRGNFN